MLLCLGWSFLALTMGSCAHEDLVIKEENNSERQEKICVKVTDSGYSDDQRTRASESNEEEYDENATIMRTKFILGDRIGVFSISEEGAIHYQNLELVFDGTEWKNPDGEPFYYFTGMKYFAYYPYNEEFDMDKVDWSRDSASGFFSKYIDEWSPQSDQSTTTQYMASDLMVGEGGLTDEDTFTFSLGHTMGLIFISAAEEIKGTIYLFPKLTEADAMENLSSDSKIYSFEQKLYKPSRKQGYYRYLVKPGQAKFISGKNPDGRVFSFSCTNVSGGRYKKYIIDGGFDPANSEIEDFTVVVGDILYNDMHIEHRPGIGIQINGSIAGIISYLAELNDEYTEGYIHGLVLNRSLSTKGGTTSGVQWAHTLKPEDIDDNPALANCAKAEEAIADKSGLSNCIAVYNTYMIGELIEKHNPNNSIYSHATPWFIPSVGQWVKILCEWGCSINSSLEDSRLGFDFKSAIRPGGNNLSDSFKYLWSPFYAVTDKDTERNPTNETSFFSSTEGNYNGESIWTIGMSNKASASFKPKEKTSSRIWRACAF